MKRRIKRENTKKKEMAGSRVETCSSERGEGERERKGEEGGDATQS